MRNSRLRNKSLLPQESLGLKKWRLLDLKVFYCWNFFITSTGGASTFALINSSSKKHLTYLDLLGFNELIIFRRYFVETLQDSTLRVWLTVSLFHKFLTKLHLRTLNQAYYNTELIIARNFFCAGLRLRNKSLLPQESLGLKKWRLLDLKVFYC